MVHRCNSAATAVRWQLARRPCNLHAFRYLASPTLQATKSSDVRKLNKSPGFYQVPPNNLTALQKVRLIC